MYLSRCLAAFCLLVHAAAAGGQPQPGIRASAIHRDVEILSADAFLGRGPGEPGERLTLDHLVREFSRAGLGPGGPDGSWFQEVALTRLDPADVHLEVRVGGRPMPFRRARDWSLAALRAGRTSVQEAPLVFMGFGIHAPEMGWDDFAGVDLRGRIAVFLLNDPDFDRPTGPFGGPQRSRHAGIGPKLRRAYELGAVGSLAIHNVRSTGGGWNQIENSDGDPDFTLASAPPAGPGGLDLIIRAEAAEALFRRAGLDLALLTEQARSAAFRPVAIPDASLSGGVTVTPSPMATRNVIARLDGTGRADETVIYGAHWDAYGVVPNDSTGDGIRNGAVDNALGTAMLLEIARAFARAPRPARTLLFIGFTSEEDGLLGARAYAEHPVRPLETTAAMINIDPTLLLPETRSVELIGGGRTDLEDSLARAAGSLGLGVDQDANPEVNYYQRADHFAFAERGVPALFFRAGRDLVRGGRAVADPLVEAFVMQRYHQRSDEYDQAWDLTGHVQEARVAYLVGREIADSGRWPAWRENAEFRELRERSAAARR